ncbi:UNVERIFIED_CONTAM: 1,4-dihydroxy-2-naphthoyl-CoA thioesterase 1 [Sesamum indicum]
MDQPQPPPNTEILDAPLHTLGFELDELSAHKVSGHLVITSKCCQLWEVQLSKCDPSKPEIKMLISSSRVTVLCNLPVPESARDAAQNLKIYAKL